MSILNQLLIGISLASKCSVNVNAEDTSNECFFYPYGSKSDFKTGK
jgi:hypothetical protein